jgi:superfamily II DNA or RNA helicase
MAIDIQWSKPRRIKEPGGFVFVREWCIPMDHRDAFFEYWKKCKYELYPKGYSVYKDTKSNDWFVRQIKSTLKEFDSPDEVSPKKTGALRKYTVKNPEGLHPWQVGAVSKLVASIKKWGCGADGSDVGVGKSYAGVAVARELKMNILVVCPKAVRESWRRVIKNHFKLGHTCVDVINYELLRVGRPDSNVLSLVKNKKSRKKSYVWKIPKNTLIIWDEAQKLKNYKTKNSEVCMSALKAGYKMLFCSATLATNPLELRTVGQCIKLFKNSREFYTWAADHGVIRGRFGLEFKGDNDALAKLHKDIFVDRGVRLSRDTIPGFPESQINAECFDMDKEDTAKIDQVYDDMNKELKKIEKVSNKDKNTNQLTAILRARQSIEMLKVPLFVDMVKDGIEAGMSVVVFCNFTETINALSKRLDTPCIVNGTVKDSLRQKYIDAFQTDRIRVILVGIAAGSSGLSLQDLTGKYPRLAIISPSYSAVMMRQATGRVWRDASKTKSIQKIVFVANTVEEKVCDNVNRKLANLDLLNDGDLS